MDTHDHAHSGVHEITWQGFGDLCRKLTEDVLRSYAPQCVVGIAKGGVLPAAVLASALMIDFYPIKLSSRRDEQVVHDDPVIITRPPADVAGRRVLLVDDISISMRTLGIARRLVEEAGASEVRCATLAVHGGSSKPEWYALTSDSVILMPWDHMVYRDRTWVVNPEYAAAVDDDRTGADGPSAGTG